MDKLKKLIYVMLMLLVVVNAYAFDNDLVGAIIEVESGGDTFALGDGGNSFGLMQISRIVLKEWNESGFHSHNGSWRTIIHPILTPNDLYIPYVNKMVGKWYLHRLKNHYLKDNYTIKRLLASYNGGITRLRKVNYDVNKMPKSTQEYVKKVLKLYDR